MKSFYLAPVQVLVAAVLLFAITFVASRFHPGFEMLLLPGLATYFVGTDWLIVNLGRAPAASRREILIRRVAIGALGLPTLLPAAVIVWMIARFGDNSWMVAPYAVASVLPVWPFVIWAWIVVGRNRPARP